MKIYELTGAKPLESNDKMHSQQLSSQCYLGIEVELERAHTLMEKEWKYWDLKGDGSLRDRGIEIVFKRPLQGKEVIAALAEMHKNISGTRVRCTEYCSTHLHMNFLSSTEQEVMNFLALYLLFEDGLARYCGPNRENNLFCLTVSNAEEQLEVLRRMYQTLSSTEGSIIDAIRTRGGQRALKYSAMNLAALPQYGTLESRLMYGIKDKDELLQWVNILLKIRSHALQMESIQDILVAVSENGPMQYIQDVLGDSLDVTPHFREEEVYEGIDRIQYILTGY